MKKEVFLESMKTKKVKRVNYKPISQSEIKDIEQQIEKARELAFLEMLEESYPMLTKKINVIRDKHGMPKIEFTEIPQTQTQE